MISGVDVRAVGVEGQRAVGAGEWGGNAACDAITVVFATCSDGCNGQRISFRIGVVAEQSVSSGCGCGGFGRECCGIIRRDGSVIGATDIDDGEGCIGVGEAVVDGPGDGALSGAGVDQVGVFVGDGFKGAFVVFSGGGASEGEGASSWIPGGCDEAVGVVG